MLEAFSWRLVSVVSCCIMQVNARNEANSNSFYFSNVCMQIKLVNLRPNFKL